METDGGEEQDSKMELVSVDNKAAGQWTSDEKSCMEVDKTDRSHSMPSQEEGTEGEHSVPLKKREISTPR